MAFEREKQSVSAGDLLQALADGDQIQLSQCTVTGVLDINRLFDDAEKFNIGGLNINRADKVTTVTFSQSIVFDKCLFEENVVFTAPWADPDSVRVHFEKEVVFNSSHFKGQARFRGAAFDDIAGFDGCTIDGVVTFKGAEVKGDAKFRTTTFNGYALFPNVTFRASARFTNSHVAKGVNFSETSFYGPTDFSGVYSSSRAVPACDSVFFARRRYGDDESFWRFVKQSALEAGYYHLAGECFYNERCAGLWQKLRGGDYEMKKGWAKALAMITKVRLLPELFLGRLLFGYGERPVRVLVASAMVILLCAFYYAQPDVLAHRFGTGEGSFFEGFYFSMITFTTLGYGDLYPAAQHSCRTVAMLEAVSGACLMALFVVCLAKRYSRG